jgi:hypothetical protein
VDANDNPQDSKPLPLLRGWLIFIAIFMALHLILPALLLHSELFGFWGNEGYIVEFQQVEDDQRLELGMQFAFDMIHLILPFLLWANLCRKFFARKSGFAFSFLKTVLLTWAVDGVSADLF